MKMEMKINLVCFISEIVLMFEKMVVLCDDSDRFLKSG